MGGKKLTHLKMLFRGLSGLNFRFWKFKLAHILQKRFCVIDYYRAVKNYLGAEKGLRGLNWTFDFKKIITHLGKSYNTLVAKLHLST